MLKDNEKESSEKESSLKTRLDDYKSKLKYNAITHKSPYVKNQNEKKKSKKNNVSFRISILIAFILIAVGIVLNSMGFNNGFFEFASFGNWIVFLGTMILIVSLINLIFSNKTIVDERTAMIKFKSAQVSYVFFLILAFILMIIDELNPLEIKISYLLSYLICAILIVNFLTYRILNKIY